VNFNHAGVIGAGAWGTALAQVAARAGLQVTLQAREPEVVASIAAERENAMFLPGVKLEDAVTAAPGLDALASCDLILAVPPAQHLRSALMALKPHLKAGAPVVLCSKGVEQGTLKLMSDVAFEVLPDAPIAVLSGPSFAGEVARGLPTAVTLACEDEDLGRRIGEAIAIPTFRPYWAADVIGAEAGAAVKNVLAIACGISEGKGLGRSAHAALITRGFAEMTRLAVALGGGQTLEQALAGKVSVAEGVASAPAVRALARSLGVETPICEAVAAILAGEVEVDAAIAGLLSRPLKSEA
jgi:glycerol-3-phosphate dehydrogenase (NAD(P)+)